MKAECLSELPEFSEVVVIIVQSITVQAVMKNSVVRVSEEGSDRSISSKVFGGDILDQKNPRFVLKFIMSG